MVPTKWVGMGFVSRVLIFRVSFETMMIPFEEIVQVLGRTHHGKSKALSSPWFQLYTNELL